MIIYPLLNWGLEMRSDNLAYDLFQALGTLLLVHHKLIGTIDWSWYWVFAPLWIPFCLESGAAFIGGFIRGIFRKDQAEEKK